MPIDPITAGDGGAKAGPASAQANPLAPEGKLDLSTVAALHAALSEARGDRITLDLANVTHFGALALQTVCAAATAAHARGASLGVINASDRVLAQMSAMGMTPETMTEPPR